MNRRKLRILMLVLLVFLICIVMPLIFAWTIIVRTPTSPLLLKFVMVGLVLKEVLLPPPMPPPSEVFRQYIMDPIPESVTNIKANRPSIIGGYRYILHFNISRADLDSIINSRPFQKVWNVKYDNGCLDWAWDTWHGFSMSGGTITVYGSRRAPRWFRPKLWDNPEVYVFEKVCDRVNTQIFDYEPKVHDRHDTQVLIYNEKESEAYFIVSSF